MNQPPRTPLNQPSHSADAGRPAPSAAFLPLQEEYCAELQALDLAAQRAHDPQFDALPQREREGRLSTSLGAVKFYARSGHSFQAMRSGKVAGFALAQSVWQGDDSIVLVRTVVTAPALASALQAEIYNGLLRAVFKSAFDTAAYQVHFCRPSAGAPPLTDDIGQIRSQGHYAVRYLGSRDETAPPDTLAE